MELLHLLNYQKKEVGKSIADKGWNTDEFILEEVPSPSHEMEGQASKLKFGEFFYIFDNINSAFRSIYSPAQDKVQDNKYFLSWKDQLKDFNSWLENLRRELELEVKADDESRLTAAEQYRRIVKNRRESEFTESLSDLQNLIRGVDKLNFETGEPTIIVSTTRDRFPYLDALIEIFSRLEDLSLGFLAGLDIERLYNLVNEIQQLNFRTLDLPLNNVEDKKLVEFEAKGIYKDSWDFLVRIYTYGRLVNLDVNTDTIKIRQILNEVSKSKIAVERLVEEVQQTSQKITVAKEAKYFADEAVKHRNNSWGWLAATVLLALMTFTQAYNSFVVAFESIKGNPEFLTLTNFQGLQFVVSKVILFTFLVGGVFWLGKVYKAHRHNYVVNRHRTNALNCFNVFVDSTTDPQIKNTVLIYAAQCIFAPQPTGYNAQESENGGIPQIVEVVKDLAGSSK